MILYLYFDSFTDLKSGVIFLSSMNVVLDTTYAAYIDSFSKEHFIIRCKDFVIFILYWFYLK